MIKPKFNDFMNIEVNGNVFTMKSDNQNGLEFQTEIEFIDNKKVKHKINYIYDKAKNRTLKSSRLTEKYSNWVASILWKSLEEGIIK